MYQEYAISFRRTSKMCFAIVKFQFLAEVSKTKPVYFVMARISLIGIRVLQAIFKCVSGID